jgi:membrane-associated phospholipid phosphatase
MIPINFNSELNLVLYLQSLGSWLISLMKIITQLGSEVFFILLMPAFYWCIDSRLGIRLGVILMLSNGLIPTLKMAFHTPRPFWYSPSVRAYVSEDTFGIPSGHSMNAATVMGFLIYSFRQIWVWITLTLLIILVGISRLVLGMHFLPDVLIGWIFGFLLLWLSILLEPAVISWLVNQKLSYRLLVSFAVSLLFILFGLIVRISNADFQIPAAWVENAASATPVATQINPFSLSLLMTASGAFFGLSAGAIWLFDRTDFNTAGSLKSRLLRYPIGIVGMFIIWYGLGEVFPQGDFNLAYTLRYLRYFLVGTWAAAGAPLLFIRLKLAEPSS